MDLARLRSGRVLLLGRDDRSLLACARSLGRRGLEVHVAWCAPCALVRRSRFVARVHDELPASDGAGAEQWFEALRSLLERTAFELVFPTNDCAVVALTARRAELEHLAALALPSPRAYDVSYDKLATWELARDLGLPVPPQRDARASGAAALGDELGWPVVLKPRHAWRPACRKWEHQVTLVRDVEELEAACAVLGEHDQVLAQGFVPGRGVGLDVLAREGEVLLAFQHERLHEPPEGGGSSYRRSAPLDPTLEREARALVRALDLTGLAMVEFRCDPASGAHWLLEVNARCWGSLPLAVAAGADFPAAAYDLHVAGRAPRSRPYHPRRYGRHLARDPWFLLANRHLRRGDPTRVRVTWRRILAELRHPLLGRERWDELTLDDPRPGLVQLGRLGRELAGLGIARARRAGDALGRGARARRARARLLRARRVLFACKGNICRSPFAAAVARRLLPDEVEVRSAGTYQVADRPCPVEARLAAAARGVDLAAHRSRVLAPGDLDAADLVLVFDRAGLGHLRHHHPRHAHKLLLAGDLEPRGARELPDPYGAGYPAFRANYGRIERLLTTVLAPATSQAAAPATAPATAP